MFTGIVESVGLVRHVESAGGAARVTIGCGQMAPDDFSVGDSISVDGGGLTVNRVEGDVLQVTLIPHTLHATTLKHLRVGTRVNIEVDLLARYLEQLLAAGR